MCVATAYLINFCEVSCLCLSYLPPPSLGISPEDLLRSWWETTISILPVATGWESSIQATTTLIPVCHLSLKQTEKIAGSFDCGDTWGCLPTAVLLFHQCSSSPPAHRRRPSRPLVHMLDAALQWFASFLLLLCSIFFYYVYIFLLVSVACGVHLPWIRQCGFCQVLTFLVHHINLIVNCCSVDGNSFSG